MTETPYIKRFIVSWEQFQRDCKALAWKLVEKQDTWSGIVAITRGGLIPAGIIARELDIKLIETFGVSSYAGKAQGAIKTIKDMNSALVGRGDGWLAVDDLVDTGSTARVIRDLLPQAHIATVYAKPAGEPLADTYVTCVSQDTWIHFPWDTDVQPVDTIAALRKSAKERPS